MKDFLHKSFCTLVQLFLRDSFLETELLVKSYAHFKHYYTLPNCPPKIVQFIFSQEKSRCLFAYTLTNSGYYQAFKPLLTQ